jgi:glycosyltransferase involved in cell wall biosynthesis
VIFDGDPQRAGGQRGHSRGFPAGPGKAARGGNHGPFGLMKSCVRAGGWPVARTIPSPRVVAAWIRASVTVVPSVWHEPIGHVAIEAMLVRRPVVASYAGDCAI